MAKTPAITRGLLPNAGHRKRRGSEIAADKADTRCTTSSKTSSCREPRKLNKSYLLHEPIAFVMNTFQEGTHTTRIPYVYKYCALSLEEATPIASDETLFVSWRAWRLSAHSAHIQLSSSYHPGEKCWITGLWTHALRLIFLRREPPRMRSRRSTAQMAKVAPHGRLCRPPCFS